MLNERYAASANLERVGIEIVAVNDPVGAHFNTAFRRLVALLQEEGGPYLDDLIGASRALRYRQVTQPQPLAHNPGLLSLADEVVRRAAGLNGAVSDQAVLDHLAAAAAQVGWNDPQVGSTLVRSLDEAGPGSSVVIAASRSAAVGLASWLQQPGLRHHRALVLTAGDLEREQPRREQAYVVGPPRFYRPSLVTSPVTGDLSFLLPAWFGDRSVPESAIAAYAEGAIHIKAREFTDGASPEPEHEPPFVGQNEDDYVPQPAWGPRREVDREPSTEEVEARKLLLSGHLAMWLDDGERIRSLDPRPPAGERVTHTEVLAVRVGTYLLLRQGESEHTALHAAAIARLSSGQIVDETQRAWKHELAQRIDAAGHREVSRQLRAAGVRSADRARAWTSPSLIRPSSDTDFERLLQWLGIPTQPTFGYATLLRKTIYLVSAEIGRQLERAISAHDLSELETSGHLRIDTKVEGFRGILATRILALSPFTEIVSRHEVRVPFEDRSAQWLE